MDWEAEGLLEGLEPGAREARRQLLDELHASGAGVDELRRAVAEDRLVLVPMERALMGPTRYSARQVAERAGIELELLLRVDRALGIAAEDPDEPAFADEDVEAARRLRTYVDAGLPADELVAMMRPVSAAVGKAAEMMRQLVGEALLEPDIDERTLARRYGDAMAGLVPLAADDLGYLLRLHLRELTRQDAVGMAERRAGGLPRSVEVAVGFADIVGFTRLGEEVPEETLGAVADRLAQVAAERVRPPVRVVKSIGDAVMLVSRDPRAMVAALLEMVEAADGDEALPQLRAGAAWGRAVARYGDWYGGTVNLASRLTARARPGSVLVSPDLREAAGDDFAWSEAGPKRLKGVSAPVPAWRVRRAAA